VGENSWLLGRKREGVKEAVIFRPSAKVPHKPKKAHRISRKKKRELFMGSNREERQRIGWMNAIVL